MLRRLERRDDGSSPSSDIFRQVEKHIDGWNSTVIPNNVGDGFWTPKH